MTRSLLSRPLGGFFALVLFALCFLTLGFECEDGDPGLPDPGEEVDALELPDILLPVGRQNHTYAASILPSGGRPPYEYFIPSLPHGLYYQGSATALIIQGTILQGGGSYPINVTVTDEDTTTVQKQYNILIYYDHIDLAGTWDLTVRNGSFLDCPGGRSTDYTATWRVTMTQVDSDLVITGLGGDPTRETPAAIVAVGSPPDRQALIVEVVLPEAGSTVEERYELNIYSQGMVRADFLSGRGTWNWAGSDHDDCDGSLEVEATRVTVRAP